jgi:hypothetical protein
MGRRRRVVQGIIVLVLLLLCGSAVWWITGRGGEQASGLRARSSDHQVRGASPRLAATRRVPGVRRLAASETPCWGGGWAV